MLAHLRELVRYRDLLFRLASRDIQVRYRQTVLGVAWAVLQPLAFMLIFTLVFSRFGNVESEGVPYPVFSYSGLLPWTLFATTLNLAVNCIAANISLVKKIYFPREVFPFGVVLGGLLDFGVASSLLGLLMLIYGLRFGLALLWLPWLIGIEVLFLIAATLVSSALNVFYRDIKYIVPIGIQLGMFVSPVIYSTAMVPKRFQAAYMLNPMAVVIDGIRRVVLHGEAPPLRALLGATMASGILALASYALFKRLEKRFADVI